MRDKYDILPDEDELAETALARRAEEGVIEAEEVHGGALVPRDDSRALAQPDPFFGIAAQPFTEKQAAVLLAPIPDTELDILPTGEVYLSQIGYRRRLNLAFGPGGWGLFPRGESFTRIGKTLCREFALFVGGRFVAEAMGEADYIENNERYSWATAAESAKSNALMRCCKDIGIASDCWDRRFTDAWIAEHAVFVEAKVKNEMKWLWRRKDAPPFRDEREGSAWNPKAKGQKQKNAGTGGETRSNVPQAKPASKPPAPASDAPDEYEEGHEYTAITSITGVEQRKSRDGKKKWQEFATEEGVVLSVWSDTQATIAASALDDGVPVAIRFSKKGRYFNLADIRRMDDDAIEGEVV